MEYLHKWASKLSDMLQLETRIHAYEIYGMIDCGFDWVIGKDTGETRVGRSKL